MEEFGLAGPRLRVEPRRPPSSPGARPTNSPAEPRQAAVRRRQHRADQEAALDGHPRRGPRPPRRDLRPDGRQLHRADPRPSSPAASTSCCPKPSFDTLVMKACLFAIDAFFEETGTRLPVMISGTIFDNGRTLSAQPVEAFYYSVSHFDALSVGLNCAVGVDLMRGSIESLSAICRTRDQLLSQRRHARRLRRLPGRQGPHGRPSWASSPATAGSTSSAAAAAPPRSGSRPSPGRSTALRPARSPTCPTGRPTAAWSRS